MRIKDGIVGLIIGDALGVPVEFKPKSELDENPVTGLREYGTYNMPKGTWSDDSSMTIATMYSIVNKKGIDYEDIMEMFLDWIEKGRFTQYNDTFDFGNTTYGGIKNYKSGKPPLECGLDDERSNGNGSLMRILPLAYIPDISCETIENVSALTHAHEISKIACVFYIEIAKSMLKNDSLHIKEHIDLASEKIKEHYKDSPELEHFKKIFNHNYDYVVSGGYVIDTFECVLYCLLTTTSYHEAVLKGVNFGRDTDTVGAICGGLAGIYYGFDNIPEEWVEDIPEIDSVIDLCNEYEEFLNEY